ncbi:hypothetical protein GCM10029963_45660 [Micromonospora andamanensis]|uniref:hypothetical protein n=1 Tax=Micromonospora andamanensis TaxID=1287068 RepID=UPI0019510A8F|nr:hypothetical protein [Micromonospora andamanensis]GIJ41358.1 hypothetical protein Vwe01_46830 [Micromonospora andamanensis]
MATPETVARALAEVVAATHNGRSYLTRTKAARELAARTGSTFAATDVDAVIRAAAPILAGTYGVSVRPADTPRHGFRWVLAVKPIAQPAACRAA